MTGTAAVGNICGGVFLIIGASGNTVGGTSAAARNVISGNGFDGVVIINVGTENNVVEGDYVGTDATGAHSLGNSVCGVGVALGASNNTVGGTSTAARDVISGNGFGVYISDSGTDDNLVEGDYIGTEVTGSVALGNANGGVILIDGAAGNTVGGTTAAARDVISGNVGAGVTVYGSGTTDNLVAGDYIGTDTTGTHALGNSNMGVSILDGASDNTIGGTSTAAREFISGNAGDGVSIDASGTTGTVVTGDDIGTDVNGTGNLGNGGDGVLLNGVTGNSITNSLICYNGGYGIEGISGSSASNNIITGDTFTVTIGTTTYGNKHGATYFH
jgi:titin